jgi:starch-binding outer membrane protein, SusD/RagB family
MVFAGCSDDFLNPISPNAVSQETFWRTEKDIKLAITGCYSVLQSTHMYNGVHNGNSGFPGLDYATDNGYMTWEYKSGGAIGMGEHSPTDGGVNGMWNISYAGIVRSNRLIANIKNVSNIEISDAARARYIAEAKFLRALHYNNLAILYRDVPLITEPQTLSEAYVSKNNKSEIVNFIINDLKGSVDDLPLPQNLPSAEWGRITRGAGYALLAHIYLNHHMYAEAAEYTKKVLDLNHYELFPNYATLFTSANEQNKEVIFPVCFKRGLNGYGSGFGWFTGTRVPDNHHPLRNLAEEYYCVDGLPISESPLYNPNLEIENRDPRFNTTLISKGSLWQGKLVANSQLALTGYAQRKWVEENTPNVALNQNDSDQDFYVFRLGHVILDRAEALVQAGGYNEAEVLGLINMIRQRVNMPRVQDVEGTGFTKERLMEIIMHERRVETAFEGRRYFDLKRWGKLKEKVDFFNALENARNPALRKRIYDEPRHNVWPIPQREIDTNPVLVQHAEW